MKRERKGWIEKILELIRGLSGRKIEPIAKDPLREALENLEKEQYVMIRALEECVWQYAIYGSPEQKRRLRVILKQYDLDLEDLERSWVLDDLPEK